jgi:glycosyltransferase involved in cell wall biosynthesis
MKWQNKIKSAKSKILKKKGYGISIIVPFYCPDKNNPRAKNWDWLQRYWKAQLPGAEIIVGMDYKCMEDSSVSFSKSCAINEGVSRANGDILVIVDADGYIDADNVLYCANEIRDARKNKKKLWFIPYRRFFRLTEDATQKILKSSPEYPYHLTNPPNKKDILVMPRDEKISAPLFEIDVTGSAFGHWYGALIHIVPSEGFEIVGGWDIRFRGWGGEDHAAMRAMDTLYWPHKTLPSPVFHMWHPFTHDKVKVKNRIWENQADSGTNDSLSHRYYWSHGNIARMRKLVDEWKNE